MVRDARWKAWIGPQGAQIVPQRANCVSVRLLVFHLLKSISLPSNLERENLMNYRNAMNCLQISNTGSCSSLTLKRRTSTGSAAFAYNRWSIAAVALLV